LESIILDIILMRLSLLIFGMLWVLLAKAEELLVIASPQVPESEITVEQLADIFTLKRSSWPNRIKMVPVNREASSLEREKFSEQVFNLPPQELGEYWNRLRFQGKLPPVIQTSDQAVLSFVRNVPGAIGYINANQNPQGVKVLMQIP
jgi:ABC-type phosphate transport system substrate-binding protein